MSYGDPNPIGLLAVAALLLATQSRAAFGEFREWFRRRTQPDRNPLDQLQHEYETTDMDQMEFERRLDELLTGDDETIIRDVQQVAGVGPDIAGAIAYRFESIEHVRQASRDELAEVPHVGPQRARQIAEHFDEGVSRDG